MPPARFITDSSLDHLARRLRFLGYDVVTAPGARLEELLEIAASDGRVVLSLSGRHPRRWSHVPMIRIPRADPAAAVRMIALNHEPAGRPFSRCPTCNQALHPRHPLEAAGEVPGRVLRSGSALTQCPVCGRWYWEGSHVARIRDWLEGTLGRPLEG